MTPEQIESTMVDSVNRRVFECVAACEDIANPLVIPEVIDAARAIVFEDDVFALPDRCHALAKALTKLDAK